MRPLPSALRICLALLAFAVPASAQIIVYPGPHAIQNAINSDNGGIIVVMPGTYPENINFMGKGIILESYAYSQGTLTGPGGDPNTIIDGGGTAAAVTFNNAENSGAMLRGFTIQNGGGPDPDGGIFNYGGIYVDNAAPTIQYNTITNNNCWGILIASAAPLIQYNDITATQTPVTGCGFTNGSGIFVGGGLAVISFNTIEKNNESATFAGSQKGGAGISVYSGSPLIIDNTIDNNSAPHATGGGIDVIGGSNVFIVQNLIYNNQAGCGGGGIGFQTDANLGTGLYLLVQNNTIVNNTGPAAAPAEGCTADSQIDPTDDGYSSPIVIFLNNIVANYNGGNTAAPATSCYQQQPDFEYNQSIFDHNILYNAGGSFFGQYCIDVSSEYGNLEVDPLFVSPSTNDFRLQYSPRSNPAVVSPAIDTGNNSTTIFPTPFDFDGNARVVDATNLGYPVIDMGAYEFQGQDDATPTTVAVTTSAPRAGVPLTITAVVSSPLGTPTGSATFWIDSTNQQAGKPGITLDSTGSATFSALLSVGAHSIYVKYSGDGTAYPPSVSVVDVVDIELIQTSESLAAVPDPALFGQTITFTVQSNSVEPDYTPNPVYIYDTNHNNAVIETLTGADFNSSGVATFTDATLSPGSHLLVASFLGTPTYKAANSAPPLNVAITTPTVLTLTSDTNPAQAEVPFTLNATIYNASGFASGSIDFYSGGVNGTLLGSGKIIDPVCCAFGPPPPPYPLPVSISTSLPGGTFNLVATYAGDNDSDSSVSPIVVETVLPDPTTLAVPVATPNPALAFQTLTLSAKLTASNSPTAPTGTISFFLANGTSLGAGAVNSSGVATLTPAIGLPAGTYTISASFAGTTSFGKSTSGSITEIVNPDATSTALTAAPNPGYSPGESVSLTAAVTPMLPTPSSNVIAPTGTLTFLADGNVLAASVPLSAPVFNVTTLAVGTHTLVTTYSGDANYLPSTSAPITLNIFLRDFSLTAGASASGPSITIETQHHANFPVTLTSVGGFTGAIALACSNLPQDATCNFAGPAPVLTADAAITTAIDIDTDALLGFESSLHTPEQPRGLRNGIALALLLPITLFAARRRFKGRGIGLFTSAVIMLAMTALSSCSGHYPGHTPPGTYTFTVTGTAGANTNSIPGTTHSATVTLIVTP